MSKVWAIIKREYWTRVRKKSFIAVTLLGPLGFVAMILGVIFIMEQAGESRLDVTVIDDAGFIDGTLADSDRNEVYFKFSDEDFETSRADMEVEGSGAILYIPPEFNIEQHQKYPIRLYSTGAVGVSKKSYIRYVLDRQLQDHKLAFYDLDEEILADVNGSINLVQNVIGEEEKDSSFGEEIGAIIGLIVSMIIYASIMVYGMMILKSVMEEKSNRIVEIIVSSVPPFKLLIGKIIGVGAVGLTQFAAWGVLGFFAQMGISFFIGTQLGDAVGTAPAGEMPDESDMAQLQLLMNDITDLPVLKIGVWALLFFLGGFLMYGSLYAAIGALVNDDAEVQPLSFVLSLPIILSFIITMQIIERPDSALIWWSSMFPLTSPIVMPARLLSAPLWEIFLSFGLLVLGFIGAVFIAGKIYRLGILMYGKKAGFKELAIWIFRS